MIWLQSLTTGKKNKKTKNKTVNSIFLHNRSLKTTQLNAIINTFHNLLTVASATAISSIYLVYCSALQENIFLETQESTVQT